MPLTHYILNTGHFYTSFPVDVDGRLIQGMRDITLPGEHSLSGEYAGFSMSVSPCSEDSGVVFTVSRDKAPVVTCSLAVTDAAADILWPQAEQLYFQVAKQIPHESMMAEASKPAQTPWLSVVFFPGAAALLADDLSRLGDLERSFAWAWIAHNTNQEK